MVITREKYEEIRKLYSDLLIVDSDPVDALNFVYDLLKAEVEAVKERAPYATASIERLERAAYEVLSICDDVDNGEYGEV